MAKVVTSQGLQDFVESGKPTEVIAKVEQKNEKKAPALEVVPDKPIVDTGEAKSDDPAKSAAVEDTGLEAEDHDLAERAKKRIGKKHYEMKKAQEEAAKAKADAEEAERFAETLFNEREEWKRKAEEAEKRAQEPPKPKVELKKPDENDEKYVKDGKFQLSEFVKDSMAYEKQSEAQAAEEAAAKQRAEQTKAEKERIAKEFGERMDKAQKKYSDWKEVVSGSTVTLQNECLQYIAQSEYGTDIAYFLAQPKNKEIAERIRSLPAIRAVAELGKLETSFEKPAAKVAEKTEATDSLATSKTVEPKGAPPPITPISTNGAGSVNVDPAKMSFRELREYERERARKRH